MGEKVTTYYNGACPVCGTEIRHYRRLAARRGLAALDWCDIAAEPDALDARGIDREALIRRLHVIDAAGRLHVGIPAFAVLWAEMPRYRWLARLVMLPVLRPLAAGLYEVAAAILYAMNKRRAAKMA